MEAIAAVVAVGVLAVLASWGAIRSRQRQGAAQEVHDEITQTLDRLERSAARLEQLDADGQTSTSDSAQGGGPVSRARRVYVSGLGSISEAGNAHDLASILAGVIFRDVVRAAERHETVFFAGSYGPSGGRITLSDREWLDGSHIDSDESAPWLRGTILAKGERSVYWHLRESDESAALVNDAVARFTSLGERV